MTNITRADLTVVGPVGAPADAAEVREIVAGMATAARPLFTVFFGDSITEATPGVGHAGLTTWLSRGKLLYRFPHSGAGVSGDTTAQMLTRVQTDVIVKNPDLVIFCGGSNDAAGLASLATFQGNVTTICETIRAAGIGLVVLSTPPRIAQTARITRYNTWLSRYCRANVIPFVDIYAPLADTATGEYETGLSTDGVHPNGKGVRIVSEAIRDALATALPMVPPMLAASEADTDNLLTNGQFTGVAGADGVADGWFLQGAGVAVASIVAPVADEVGNWQRIVWNSGVQYLIQTVAAAGKMVADDRLIYAIRYRSGGQEAGGAGPAVHFTVTGGSGHTFTAATVHGQAADVVDAIICLEITLGTMPTSVGVDVTFQTEGAGWFEVAQATLLNLTVLGIA